LGAAIPTPDGGWRRLLGDEIGWLLADHILRHTTGDDRLVITTLVSSSLLSKMAAEYGVRFAETYTGFKWIGHTVLSKPESHFVFGYEQALGYLVCGRPLDKDGISAAVLLAEVAALARAEGVTLQSRLDAINDRFGRHVMADMSVKMPPVDGTAAVARMRADPPTVVDDRQVSEVKWFDEAGLLRLQLGPELRLQLRPSGTEPKVKLYGEGIGIDPSPYLHSLSTLL
jgi:phosphomannomutase